jgi:FG-GAP-like repeat
VRTAVVVAVVGFAVAGGCLRRTAYRCEQNAQCVLDEDQGSCEPDARGDHYCAFADAACPSHLRFGDDAALDDAGQCAGGPLPAGRSPDVCLPGARFPTGFSSCTQTVCAELPTCCTSSWGTPCVVQAEMECALPCGTQLAFATAGTISIVADDEGNGTFGAVATAGDAGQAYSAAAWVDLDGAGPPELAIGTADFNTSGDEQAIYQLGGDVLTRQIDLRQLHPAAPPLQGYDTLAISVGDYDGDGWADLAFLGTYPALEVVRNAHAPQLDVGPDVPQAAQDLIALGAWGDVDHDGDDDLAIVGDAGVDLLTSDGGQLAVTWSQTLPNRTYWIGWGDLDNDGWLDLALSGDGFVRVYRNSAGTLDQTPSFDLSSGQYEAGTWIDVDDDGDQDLAVAGFTGPVEVFENRDGILQPTPLWHSVEDQDSPQMIAADVDDDGYLDLVLANHPPYPPRIYRNNGDDTFSPVTLDLPAGDYTAVAATARTP